MTRECMWCSAPLRFDPAGGRGLCGEVWQVRVQGRPTPCPEAVPPLRGAGVG